VTASRRRADGPARRLPRRLILVSYAAHAALAATASFAAAGCMPWVVGETAETLERGVVRVDLAAAALVPPGDATDLLPVPQLRVAAGVREGLDAAATWVPPLTGHGRVRLRLHRTARWAAAGSVGAGVHGVPDVADAGTRFAVPFATAALQLSTRGEAPRWHGSLRAILPAHLGEAPAFTVWLAPQLGVELGADPLRWGGEVGVVVPVTHADRTQLVLGVSARWSP